MEVRKQIEKSMELQQKLLADEAILSSLEDCIQLIADAYRADGKVLFCGNGGSAADAQHLSAELSGCFYMDRDPLNAEALHVNSSFLTATANDLSYDKVYERMIQAIGRQGDVLVALSTSGTSANILKALKIARERGLKTIGMTGSDGRRMAEYCDVLIRVPSADTPRIQEMHMLLGHIICENVESILFRK